MLIKWYHLLDLYYILPIFKTKFAKIEVAVTWYNHKYYNNPSELSLFWRKVTCQKKRCRAVTPLLLNSKLLSDSRYEFWLTQYRKIHVYLCMLYTISFWMKLRKQTSLMHTAIELNIPFYHIYIGIPLSFWPCEIPMPKTHQEILQFCTMTMSSHCIMIMCHSHCNRSRGIQLFFKFSDAFPFKRLLLPNTSTKSLGTCDPWTKTS